MKKQQDSNNTETSIKIPNEIQRKKMHKASKYRGNVVNLAILGLLLALGIAAHAVSDGLDLNWPGTSLGFDLDIFTVILALHYTNIGGAIFIAFGKEILGSLVLGNFRGDALLGTFLSISENIVYIFCFWLIHYFLHIFLSQQRLFKRLILGKKHLGHDCIENQEKCAFATDIIVTFLAGILAAIILTLFMQLFLLNWYNQLGFNLPNPNNKIEVWSIFLPFFLALYALPGFIGSIVYRTVKYLKH